MHSMLFEPAGKPQRGGRLVAPTWDQRASSARQWLTALLIISIFILYPENPAWGGGINAQAGPRGENACNPIALTPASGGGSQGPPPPYTDTHTTSNDVDGFSAMNGKTF